MTYLPYPPKPLTKIDRMLLSSQSYFSLFEAITYNKSEKILFYLEYRKLSDIRKKCFAIKIKLVKKHIEYLYYLFMKGLTYYLKNNKTKPSVYNYIFLKKINSKFEVILKISLPLKCRHERLGILFI